MSLKNSWGGLGGLRRQHSPEKLILLAGNSPPHLDTYLMYLVFFCRGLQTIKPSLLWGSACLICDKLTTQCLINQRRCSRLLSVPGLSCGQSSLLQRREAGLWLPVLSHVSYRCQSAHSRLSLKRRRLWYSPVRQASQHEHCRHRRGRRCRPVHRRMWSSCRG